MANSFEAERYQSDGNYIDYTPGSAVSAGAVVVLGAMCAVAEKAIEANRKGALATDGVFRVAKSTATGSAIAVGKLVYWDDTNNVATETSTDNTQLGYTVAAASDSDSTVLVKLSRA